MEKTLLQQIREKEQDVAKKIVDIRVVTEASITAAKEEAENLLCTANAEGNKTAEEVYWREKGRTQALIETLNEEAGRTAEAVTGRGKKNIPAAVDAIVRYVTMVE